MPPYYVYILTNTRNTVLYTGVTNNLLRRIGEHRRKDNPKAFTSRYNLWKLVYFEAYTCIHEAIAREKRIKNCLRKKKQALVSSMNPDWRDLFEDVFRAGYNPS